MLRNLEEQLSAGHIDQAAYDARRAEVMELIRKRRAIQYVPWERTVLVVAGLMAIGLMVMFLVGVASGGGSIVVLVLIVGLLILGFTLLGRGIKGAR